jgi:hypothetical protein
MTQCNISCHDNIHPRDSNSFAGTDGSAANDDVITRMQQENRRCRRHKVLGISETAPLVRKLGEALLPVFIASRPAPGAISLLRFTKLSAPSLARYRDAVSSVGNAIEHVSRPIEVFQSMQLANVLSEAAVVACDKGIAGGEELRRSVHRECPGRPARLPV